MKVHLLRRTRRMWPESYEPVCGIEGWVRTHDRKKATCKRCRSTRGKGSK